jgi:S-methylmethionine-dependent homocysteine/selenocysteine methylase
MSIILDGALSTELRRQGIGVSSPWWTSGVLRSTKGRRALAGIHARYVAAGATVITANTFRANLRAMRRAGLDAEQAGELVRAAVSIARAAAPAGVRVAASVAPVEDCYAPRLVPPDPELSDEHGWLAEMLARSDGVDIVLAETMNTIREARIAVERATAAGLTAWASFVCGDGGVLLSGESLADAVPAVERAGAEAVLVNCTSVPRVEAALQVLAAVSTGPFGAYPNVEDRADLPYGVHVDRHIPIGMGPVSFAATARSWQQTYGATIIGGCCGSTPRHIAALRDAPMPA